MSSGTGADQVFSSSDIDDFVRVHGADVLSGSTGADFIKGDGNAELASIDQPTYAAAIAHSIGLFARGACNEVRMSNGSRGGLERNVDGNRLDGGAEDNAENGSLHQAAGRTSTDAPRRISA